MVLQSLLGGCHDDDSSAVVLSLAISRLCDDVSARLCLSLSARGGAVRSPWGETSAFDAWISGSCLRSGGDEPACSVDVAHVGSVKSRWTSCGIGADNDDDTASTPMKPRSLRNSEERRALDRGTAQHSTTEL